jgi:hypothetical protein
LSAEFAVVEVFMRLIAFAMAGLVTVGAGAASAQPMWGPDQGRFYGPERAPLWQRDRGWIGAMTPQQAAYIVETMGLDPVGPPLQSGRLIVQRAVDEFGRVMRVTIDLNNGRVVSVAPAGAPPPVNGGPYATYRPYGPGPYARPAPEADDDEEFAPRGSVMAPRATLPPGAVPPPGALSPPRAATATPYPPSAYPANPYPPAPPRADAHKPTTKSATATPGNPPQPRKRPDNPQAAKKAEPGSVAPVQPAPAPAPGATPAVPSTAMPPPAPLE